jgi:predicted metal-dependent phosphoesterase TrpH
MIDLHTHTSASDGDHAPADLVRRAARAGIQTLAVTDHDTTEGIPEALKTAEAVGIRLVPGIEISAHAGGKELHLLGLFVDPALPAFREFLVDLEQSRHRRIEKIVEKLRTMGVDITVQEVMEAAEHGSVGRPHVARVMVRKGIVSSFKSAFARFLGNDGPAYLPAQRVSPAKAIEAVHRAGGVACLAHPALNDVYTLIPELVECGMDAIEIYYPEHTPKNVKEFLATAEKYDLLISGGSDYHGPNRSRAASLGGITLPQNEFDRLEARHVEYRNA